MKSVSLKKGKVDLLKKEILFKKRNNIYINKI